MAYADVVLSKTPWGFWRCQETSGTVLDDASPNSRDMTLGGTPTLNQPGPVTGGTAISWPSSGTDRAITTATIATSTYTAAVWVKLTSPRSGVTLIGVASGYGGGSTDKNLWVDSSGRVNFSVFSGGSPVILTSVLSLDTWHFVVASVGPAGMKIRVDGVAAASNAAVTSSYTGAMGVMLHAGGSAYYYSGPAQTAEPAVFTTQLSDADADAIYAAAAGASSINGTLSAALPALTAAIAGTYAPPLVTGSLTATLPALTASLSGTYTAPAGPVTGTLAATLPALTASLAGTYTAPTTTAPVNDLWADALEVVLTDGEYVSPPISNVGASSVDDPNAFENGHTRSCWWTFTPAGDGTISLDTELSTSASDPDTILTVYTGATFSTLTLVASDDDSGAGTGADFTSRINDLAVTAGTKYSIKVTCYASLDTTYVLRAVGTIAAAEPDSDTDLTFSNDGYNYTGLARVFYDPPVAEPPAHVRRTKVRQVHQSMPAPTLVDGRPT